jgi:hypothetical protein
MLSLAQSQRQVAQRHWQQAEEALHETYGEELMAMVRLQESEVAEHL